MKVPGRYPEGPIAKGCLKTEEVNAFAEEQEGQHKMKPVSTAQRILLVIAVAGGIVACNRPTVGREPPRPIGASATGTVSLPTQWGRVWFNHQGEVVGILFSTSQGDFFESRDGVFSGFIRLEQPSISGDREPPTLTFATTAERPVMH